MGYTAAVKSITISKAQARRFLLHHFALERWQSLPSVERAIQALEFVQEDSINVCGRMHELILWPRVQGYAPERLAEALYGPEAHAFEVHFPNLAALPRTDYPHFVGQMKERQRVPGRWQGLFPEEEPVAQAFLEALDTYGPLCTRDHGNDFGHTRSGWGTRATVVSQVAEKLWLQGTLSIAQRRNFERYFDRTERVAPALAAWHAPAASLPSAAQSAQFRARKRLRARRLFRPKRDELSLLGETAFCRVELAEAGRPWYCLSEDAEGFSQDVVSSPLVLLAPLDPLIYDRERTHALFDFEYTWEVYTPESKRRWGYYVLPLLQGERLVGRLDPKLDRKTQTLRVLSLILEEGVPMAQVLPELKPQLYAYAAFLGARELDLSTLPAHICKHLAA